MRVENKNGVPEEAPQRRLVGSRLELLREPTAAGVAQKEGQHQMWVVVVISVRVLCALRRAWAHHATVANMFPHRT
jgi:hypothetical protein